LIEEIVFIEAVIFLCLLPSSAKRKEKLHWKVLRKSCVEIGEPW
jgi:hypothetical protein